MAFAELWALIENANLLWISAAWHGFRADMVPSPPPPSRTSSAVPYLEGAQITSDLRGTERGTDAVPE